MEIEYSSTFKRDLKRLKRKHYPVHLITACIEAIVDRDAIKLRIIKDHALSGKWSKYREFHPARINNTSGKQFDQWIVVYCIDNDRIVLTLIATGNHDILKSI